MRLLNTTSFKLKEFFGDNIPGYAILSHRWEDEEVTLQDLQHGRGPQMAGYSKIQGFCKQAAAAGWEWAWADSCCIDKTSSSELSETINSMFKWVRIGGAKYFLFEALLEQLVLKHGSLSLSLE